MTSNYTPAAGTVPRRLLDHMSRSPAGTPFSAAELADAGDCAQHSIKNYLATCLKNRLVIRTRDEFGGGSTYHLPSLDPFDADEDRGGRPDQRIVAAAKTKVQTSAPNSVFAMGGPAPVHLVRDRKHKVVKVDKTVRRPPPAAQRTAVTIVEPSTPSAPDLSCALFNTGELLIEAPGQQPLRLTHRQVADLVQHLRSFNHHA